MSKDDSESKGFNWNLVALGILLIAYLFSAGRFFIYSATHSDDGDHKIVRVAHWQLEPGYREALEWAMNEYNNLPHVKEAGITVTQMALPTRVYPQFMNVHLISGTAPDIAAAGFSTIIEGSSIARFYASLGEYVKEPNPYNSRKYTNPEMEEELREYLAVSPWKETFLDGMEGGWKSELNDYYSVPVSSFGSVRMFYNTKLVNEAKEYILANIDKKPQPEWLQKVWIKDVDGEVTGYLPDNERLRTWLDKADVPPETLGQFILFCFAIEQMAVEQGRSTLTPISVGNYAIGDPIYRYQASFFRHLGNDQIEQNGSPGITGLEAMDALHRGAWTFQDEPIIEFVKLAKLFSSFYPAGYMGLDREQVQRRFVSGDAAVFASGGWDAAGVYKGSQESEDPSKRFQVQIKPVPTPAPDERWADMLYYLPSEANFKAGVPLAVNKQSRNFDWSLDFLKFLSSQPINEEFNRRAAWLPAALGAKPVESMVEFSPIIEGYPSEMTFNPTNSRAPIRSKWQGDFKLMVTGEMSYEDFSDGFMEYLENPYQGMQGYWYQDRQSARDRTRALDRNLSVEEFFAAKDHDSKVANRFQSLFYQSLGSDEGVMLDLIWSRLHPGEPFPDID